MNDKKLRTPVGAILLLISTLYSIFGSIISFINSGHLFGVDVIIQLSFVALCISLLMKKRNIIVVGSLSVISVCMLYLVFLYLNLNISELYLLSTKIIRFIAYILLSLISLVFCEPQIIKKDLSKFADILKKLYFVPALALTINLFIPIIYYAMQSFISRGFSNIIDKVLNIVGILLIAKWIVDPYKKEVAVKENQINDTTGEAINEEAYCSLGKHIVLCLFTFGIWYLIWIHRTTKFLNKTPNAEQYNPTNKLLLCMFVPFYQIYWFYKHGQRIDTFSKYKGLNNSDMATLCLILGIFIPIVACILMQDRINHICTTNDTKRNSTPNLASDELKKLKELLDIGIITQEEFDAKKKQLLGL